MDPRSQFWGKMFHGLVVTPNQWEGNHKHGLCPGKPEDKGKGRFSSATRLVARSKTGGGGAFGKGGF